MDFLSRTPLIGPIAPDGAYQRWCKWCGLREAFSRKQIDLERGIIPEDLAVVE